MGSGADQGAGRSSPAVHQQLRGTEPAELVAKHQVPDTVLATPVAVGNRLYIKSDAFLYCFE